MQRIALGRSGVQISRVVFGSMPVGPARLDWRERGELLRAAVAAGISSFDTAPLYEFGRNEELLADALAELRPQVQILTKVGLRWDGDPHGEVLFRFRDGRGRERIVRKDSRPGSIRREVEQSLVRLKLDVLDLVQVHHPDVHTPIAETMGALADLAREGKLRAAGVSNYDAAQMREAQVALGPLPLASNQACYSLLERGVERELLPAARALGVSVLAYSPLARGLLRGSLRRSALSAFDTRLSDSRFFPANLRRIEAALARVLAPVAHARGASVAQVALAWVLAQPGTSAVVVGASSPGQARENARAAEIVLAADEIAAIGRGFDALEIDPRARLGWVERLRMRGIRGIARVLGR